MKWNCGFREPDIAWRHFRSAENMTASGKALGETIPMECYPQVDLVYIDGKDFDYGNRTQKQREILGLSYVSLARRVISVLRPRIVVLEALAGLPYSWVGHIHGEFSLRGYDCEWSHLSFGEFGIPLSGGILYTLAFPSETRTSPPSVPSILNRERIEDLSTQARRKREDENSIVLTSEKDCEVFRSFPKEFTQTGRGHSRIPSGVVLPGQEINSGIRLPLEATPPDFGKVIATLCSDFFSKRSQCQQR